MRYASLFAFGLIAGCGSDGNPAPFSELHPVKGVVLRGGVPVNGGSVEFAMTGGSTEFLVNSDVGADGNFTLTTVRTTDSRGERKTGAPAGTYTATYRPPVADQTTGHSNPVTLPKSAIVEAKANDLKLELPAKK